MEPTRDPTPPPARRRPTDLVPGVDRRPLWLAAPGIAVFLMGAGVLGVVAWIGSSVSAPAGRWSWLAVGVFLIGLSPIFLLVIPGVLIALRHRWGGAFLSLADPRFAAHPRLAGLAFAWFGLLFGCLIGWPPFFSWSAATPTILRAIGIVACVPLAALPLVLHFDRGREPPDGSAR